MKRLAPRRAAPPPVRREPPPRRAVRALALAALAAGCNSLVGIEQAEGPEGIKDGKGGRAGAGGGAVVIEPPKYDAESSTWCEEALANAADLEFCADFDAKPAAPGGQAGRAALPDGFDAAEASPGMTLALTSGRHLTRWNDLLVYSPPNEGFGNFNAKATRQFPGTPTGKFTLTFDFYPEQVPAAPGAVALVAVVEFVRGEPYSLRLVSAGGKLRLEESRLAGLDVAHESTTFDLALGAWTRVELDVVLDPVDVSDGDGDGGGDGEDVAPPRARVSAGPGGGPAGNGGLTQIGGDVTLNVPAGLVREEAQFILGVAFGTMPHTGWKLRYDNVTLDLDQDAL